MTLEWIVINTIIISILKDNTDGDDINNNGNIIYNDYDDDDDDIGNLIRLMIITKMDHN